MRGNGTSAFAGDQHTGRSHRLARSIHRAWHHPDPSKETWRHCRRACRKGATALAKKIQRPANRGLNKSEGRLRFRKRPSYLMTVSRILCPEFLRGDDHLSHPNFSERPTDLICRDATIPEGQTASPTVAHSCQRTGGVFSVTLSVTAILQLRRPRVLRGMSPYGVRTFLQQASRLTSDHLPSRTIYHNQPGRKEHRELGKLI